MKSTTNQEFVAFVVDLMQPIGPVTAKRMFGGHGLFLNGLMIALIAQNTLYLKVDEHSKADFIDQGLQAFTYQKKDKLLALSYMQAPEEIFEDSMQMNTWGNKAYSAALRAAKKTHKQR